jgi:alpha-glucosidase (family GH31 glycosyl hydrolase)
MKAHIYFLLIVILIPLFIIKAGNDNSNVWSSGNFRVELNKGRIVVLKSDKVLTVISSIEFNFTKPDLVSVKTNSPEKLTLEFQYPGYAKYREEGKTLTALVDITVINNSIRFLSDTKWAQNVTINLVDNGEHYFGILEPLYPDNRKSPDLRGEVVDVEILGNDSQYHENYADIWSAFYMTDKGYASFFDSFAKGKYKLGINQQTSLYHKTGKLDWYIITGNNGDEILKDYYGIIGKPKFVPMWACGPVAWRDENKGGKDEILSDIRKMTELQIPFTAWFVDRPYSNGSNDWSKMDFNSKFSEPQKWIAEINNKYSLQFMTWVGPMTFDDKDFPGLLPNFRGYMDLSNPDAIKEFKLRMNKFQYSNNVRGHKMDRADEQFPEMSPWFDKTPEPERRNKYIYLYSKTIDDFLSENFKTDEFNFARSAFHRCQPYLSAVWGGDSRSSWDGLAGSIANSIRCSFMGFPVWGSDVGGYLGGRIPEELYIRWLQFGSWAGLFETKLDDAGGRGEDRPPWKYSDKLITVFRNCTSFRMEMQPFLYSLANTSYKNGVLMKPLAYLYPGDKNTYDIWNEYVLGNIFLVAPVTDTTGERKVYLPEGKWIDFYNRHLHYSGGKEITVTTSLDHIPVFIKTNSLYITGRMIDGNSKLWNTGTTDRKLNIYAFPGEPGETFTFDYVDYKDNNTEKKFVLSSTNKKVEINSPNLITESVFIIKLDVAPASITLNDENVRIDWDNAFNTVTVMCKKGINTISVTLF